MCENRGCAQFDALFGVLVIVGLPCVGQREHAPSRGCMNGRAADIDPPLTDSGGDGHAPGDDLRIDTREALREPFVGDSHDIPEPLFG